MAGLLDFIGSPEGQGLLSAAFGGMASARQGTPWNNFGRAGVSGLVGYNQALDQNGEIDQRKQRQQVFDLTLKQMQQQAADRDAERNLAAQSFRTPEQMAMAANGGPTNAAAAAIPTSRSGFDHDSYIDGLAKINPTAALSMRASLRPKFSTTPQYDQSGRAFVVSETGGIQYLDGVRSRDKIISDDNGGTRTFRTEYSAVPVATQAKTVSPDAVLSSSTTIRGQNQTAQTAANSLAQSAREVITLDTPNGPVVLPKYAQGPVTAAPLLGIDGKPVLGKSGALTETQGNSVAFGIRASNALKNLDKLDQISGGDYYAAQLPWGTGNFMMSANGQQAMNAEKQFVAAILRKESGAAISNEEYSTTGNQFFPRPGDTPAQLEQKRTNRELALKGLDFQAGPAGARSISEALAQQAAEDDARAKAEAAKKNTASSTRVPGLPLSMPPNSGADDFTGYMIIPNP